MAYMYQLYMCIVELGHKISIDDDVSIPNKLDCMS
jgi:hypothetical protein